MKLKGFKEFLKENDYCKNATDEQIEFIQETAEDAVFELSQYIEFGDSGFKMTYEHYVYGVVVMIKVLSLDLKLGDFSDIRSKLDRFFKDYCKG